MAASIDRSEKHNIRHRQDKKECWMTGVCVLPDGGWIVLDVNNHVLKRLDRDFTVTGRCDMAGLGLWDVCHIPGSDLVALTTGSDYTIELVSVDKMERVGSGKMDHTCWGITCTNNSLYVTARWGTSVFVYSLPDLTRLRTIQPRDEAGHARLSRTRYITRNTSGSRLLVADWDKGVFVLDVNTGNVLHHHNVGTADRICLGEEETAFVGVADPYRIIQVDRNGKLLGTVVTMEMLEGLVPWGVSYDKTSRRLVVTVLGYNHSDKKYEPCDYMFVFHLK